MKPVLKAVEYLYESDPILRALVGQDAHDEWKVYHHVAPQGTEPPWVVYQIIPGPPPEGHYGDANSIRAVPVQFRVWSGSPQQSWDIWQALDDLLDDPFIEIELTPWTNLTIKLITQPGEELEIDTGLYNVSADYNFVVSR